MSPPVPRPLPDVLSGAVQQRLRDAHLLLLPDGVTPETVETLVRTRVDDARLVGTRRCPLARRSSISGPFVLDDDTAVAVRVPLPWSMVYALEAPVERDPVAFADIADKVQRAWWMRLFPDGMPYREEGEVVDLALALARRLGGAVRAARRPVVVQPEPGRLVDLTIWSPIWLGPGRLLRAIAPVLPGAEVDLQGRPWGGPAPLDAGTPDALDPAAVEVAHALDDRLRTAVSVVGSIRDAQALAAPEVLDGYEVLADERLRVAVMPETAVPAWVQRRLAQRGHAAGDEVTTFRIGWRPEDLVPLEAERPPYLFRLARERIRPRLQAAARAIADSTQGVVTDADGFEVDRYVLGSGAPPEGRGSVGDRS